MKSLRLVSVCLGLLAAAGSSSATDESLKNYKEATEFGLIDCRDNYWLGQANGEYVLSTGLQTDADADIDAEKHAKTARQRSRQLWQR